MKECQNRCILCEREAKKTQIRFLGTSMRMCCEILKYSQVYEPYRSIVGQERGRTHKDLNERRKIN